MMEQKPLRHDLWVVVCDGRKALLLRNEGDAKFPNLRKQDVLESTETAPTHDLGTAKPGRVFSGRDGRPAAVEPTDLHKEAEDRFLANLGKELDRRVHENAIKAMILVAPPRAMGSLRSHLSDRVRASVLAEIEKDYVKAPIYDIEQHLKAILGKPAP